MRITALTIAALVLVVDDEPAFRDASQRLERRGYAIVAEAVDDASARTDVSTPVDAYGVSGAALTSPGVIRRRAT